MELHLFDFIDKTLEIRMDQMDHLVKIKDQLDHFFNDNYRHIDGFLNTNCRIKSAESMREKILRNNLYLKYKTPEIVFNNLSDIIGLRIECRFTKDERLIYEELMDQFTIPVGNGYYRCRDSEFIFLNLDEIQPQSQRNGFGIYKIDGYYEDVKGRINFELQIKSLVNVFWGEIDHRILYKNYNYLMTEDFFRDIMYSIKDNLTMIDRQLMILYDHVNQMDASITENSSKQVRALLSKIIHDLCVSRVHGELGFVINFEPSSDAIVDYFYEQIKESEDPLSGNRFLLLLNQISHLEPEKIDIYSLIEFEREPKFQSPFSTRIAGAIGPSLNKDFGWNLMMKVLSEVENEPMVNSFEHFINHIERKIKEQIDDLLSQVHLNPKEEMRMSEFLLDEIGKEFAEHVDAQYILSHTFGPESFFNSRVKMILNMNRDVEDKIEYLRPLLHKNNRNYYGY